MSQMEYNLAKQTMENNKNNETQSRREFFKEAARKALPIIGAVSLLSNPVIANAMENEVMSCTSSCYNSCSGKCTDACTGRCKEGCSGCGTACQKGCSVGCTGTCSGHCSGKNKY